MNETPTLLNRRIIKEGQDAMYSLCAILLELLPEGHPSRAPADRHVSTVLQVMHAYSDTLGNLEQIASKIHWAGKGIDNALSDIDTRFSKPTKATRGASPRTAPKRKKT